jgi:DNA-binding NarL/FixJ family response regulator
VALAIPVRIVVADDHAPTRAVIREALEQGGFCISAEASDAAGAVAAVRKTRPQVALLDIRMPGNGIEAAAAIAANQPTTSIVMLTVSEDDDDLFGALRVGASGYLLKGMDPKELPATLRGVLVGEAALPPMLVARLVTEFRNRARRRLLALGTEGRARLTTREWEVLELMERGLSTADIADRLFIAKVTVRSHIAAILHKLHVSDRASAVRLLRYGRS